MTYLLIALVLAIILSPLLSLRPSPRQKLVASLRQCASRNGLQVRLSRQPGARDDDNRLECVCYRLPWPKDSEPSSLRRAEQWLLVRSEHRGDPSAWQGWRWLTLQPAAEIVQGVDGLVSRLIEDVVGLEANRDGLSIYWQEHGSTTDVEHFVHGLNALQEVIRPPSKK